MVAHLLPSDVPAVLGHLYGEEPLLETGRKHPGPVPIQEEYPAAAREELGGPVAVVAMKDLR